MSFLYSGSLWSSLYCGFSSLFVGLYRWLVKVSWLGLKILLLDHPPARKNRTNHPPRPSERRASHHIYLKRHPAGSRPQSPVQAGVRVWSMWWKFTSYGQFPTSQRGELTNKLANRMLWKGEETTSKLGKHRRNTFPREGSIWAEFKWEH